MNGRERERPHQTERHSTNIAFIDNHFVQKRKFYYSRLAINFPTENMYSHSHSPLWRSLTFFSLGRWHVGRSASAYQSYDDVVYSLASLFFFSSGIDFSSAHPTPNRNESSGFACTCSLLRLIALQSVRKIEVDSFHCSVNKTELRLGGIVLLNFRSRAMIFNDPMRLLFIPLCSVSIRCSTHSQTPYEASEFIFDSCGRRQSVNSPHSVCSMWFPVYLSIL